jgi:hypothetical protein
MSQTLISIILLALLYLTRRKLTRELSKLMGQLGDGHRSFIAIWSVIFLPGTIIHEVSHFFAAAFTGAKTYDIEIFPKLGKLTLGQESKEHIRLGSVKTQKLGIVRGFVIGTAPLIVGLILLVWIASTLPTDYQQLTNTLELAKLYLFFNISNSLFLSWTDIKKMLPLVVIGLLFLFGDYLTGFAITISALLISVGLNTMTAGLLWSINWLMIRFLPQSHH